LKFEVPDPAFILASTIENRGLIAGFGRSVLRDQNKTPPNLVSMVHLEFARAFSPLSFYEHNGRRRMSPSAKPQRLNCLWSPGPIINDIRTRRLRTYQSPGWPEIPLEKS